MPDIRSHIGGRISSMLPLPTIMLLLCSSLSLVAQIAPPDLPDTSDVADMVEIGEPDVDPTFRLFGSVGASVTGYEVDRLEPRREPFSWTVDGALDATIGGVDIPIDFIFSEQERSFRQPFNRIGLSPGYGPVRLHLGYRSLRMSEYTLGSTTFLGAGVEITPGPLYVGAMYGRLQRAVEEDTAAEFVLPAFERWGYGAKIGVQTTGAEVSLIYFHAEDDSSSLERPPSEIPGIRPMENSVVGLLLGFDILPGELRFEAEGAGSILSRDVGAAESDSNDIPRFLSSIQPIRNSTTFTLASRLELLYTSENLGVGLAWERIEPEYESLGTWYVTTDVERFLLEPTLTLADGRLRFLGAIGLEHDNLLDTRVAQTDRIIGSGSLGWDITTAFGVDASYLNFTTGQAAGREPLNDTIAVRSVSQSAMLGPRLFLAGGSATHFISLLGSLQEYTDLNAFTNVATDSRSLTGNLVYSIGLATTPVTAGASLLYGETTTADLLATSVGGSVNGGVSLFDARLSVNGTLGYTRTTQEFAGAETAADVLNESLSATLLLGENGSLLARIYATQSSGDLSLGSDFNELTAELAYRHRIDVSAGGRESEEPDER